MYLVPCNIETIFVAERSAELYERVKTYAEEKAVRNMIVVFNNGEPGLSAARNLGIKEARGDIIAFIDDDALPFPDWAEEMVKTYEDDQVIAVTGPALPLWEHKAMAWFPEEFYWISLGSYAVQNLKDILQPSHGIGGDDNREERLLSHGGAPS